MDSAGRTGPEVLDGTFADLEFSQALLEVRVGEIIIPQGFFLKGCLNLPSLGFQTSFDIEICLSHIHVDGHIKNAITVIVDNTLLFALASASDPNRGPSLELTIKYTSPPYCYFSGNIYLLGMSSAGQFQLSDKGMQFHGAMSYEQSAVQVDAVINSTTYLDLSASCTLDLSMPPFTVGAVNIPYIKIVKFAASLTTRVSWVITWELKVAGKLKLVDLDLGEVGPFTVGADCPNLSKIADYVVNQIKEGFGSRFRSDIEKILAEGVKEAVMALKSVGLEAFKTAELLVEEIGCDIEEVMKHVKEIFGLKGEDLANIMKDLEETATEVARSGGHFYVNEQRSNDPFQYIERFVFNSRGCCQVRRLFKSI